MPDRRQFCRRNGYPLPKGIFMTQDAIIIGGSFAGLSAALMLARARRHITIIDSGTPRNRYASHAHGILAMDGKPGHEILSDARAQLATYPTVRFVEGEAAALSGERDAFRVSTTSGDDIDGRRVLLATGFEDILPDIPGIAARWGKTVLHCPYCHGYEIGRGSIGVLALSPHIFQHAGLFADWGDVTLFANGLPLPNDATLGFLEQRGVRIEEGRVLAVEDAADQMAVLTDQGGSTRVKALFVAPGAKIRGAIPSAIGLDLTDHMVGKIIATSAGRQTSVQGVYAAGDIVLGAANIPLVSADGVTAGHNIHRSLIWPDI
jgi:thioredoxin reductase